MKLWQKLISSLQHLAFYPTWVNFCIPSCSYLLCHIHFPTQSKSLHSQSWRHRIWPMIFLPTFLQPISSLDVGLQISLQFHSSITTITSESFHQSPADSSPAKPASRLQGILSYLLHLYRSKYNQDETGWSLIARVFFCGCSSINMSTLPQYISPHWTDINYYKTFKIKIICSFLLCKQDCLKKATFPFCCISSALHCLDSLDSPEAPPKRRLTQRPRKFIWHGCSQAWAGLL